MSANTDNSKEVPTTDNYVSTEQLAREFRYLSTKTVSHTNNRPTITTGKDEAERLTMARGDKAHFYRVDANTLVVRIEEVDE